MKGREARKITAALKNPSYAPPPRSITNIRKCAIPECGRGTNRVAETDSRRTITTELSGSQKRCSCSEWPCRARYGRTQQRWLSARRYEIAKTY